MASHQNIEVNLLRVPGSMATAMPDGSISNLYGAKLLNKTAYAQQVDLRLLEPKGAITIIGALKAGPQETGKTTVMVQLPKAITGQTQTLRIAVMNGDEQIQTLESNFQGP